MDFADSTLGQCKNLDSCMLLLCHNGAHVLCKIIQVSKEASFLRVCSVQNIT